MEEGNQSTEYWCHQCFRAVETITDSETIKCTLCHSGFVEQIDTIRTVNHNHHHHGDSALSLLAPVLLRMMSNNPLRRRRFRQIESNENNESNMRQRRRRPATVLHILQNFRAGIVTESDNNNSERVIFVNPFNQTIIGSLGDYLVGSRLEVLLQRLAENDPNRYGSPPARKEVVEEMPVVKIETDLIQCSVCLEDFLVGNEVKQMPCKHKFHGDCIKPWLDLHSSCPVCRYRLPCSESKGESSRAITVNSVNPIQWGFNSFFSSTSGTQTTNQNLIINPLDPPGSGSGSRVHEGGEEDDD